ncbi:hypothetical protein [Flavobacterium johnsoniae]|jgi:hypothetical protein|uniref:Lipoprotein n=1 Tax=Flavobacterium johnsoniae TaxID=986 RepID=A0A1J7CRW8_FLAJO|nr:hypothetical protein [Flavobacterium johnsoniae]OIV42386.1 hypothetical protein BKM63_05760 [Flavobacterium johnsoniae]
MNKVTKISVLFLALAILVGCKKRDTFENNSFSDKTFNWTISIPEDYEKMEIKDGKINEDPDLAKRKHSIVAFKKDKANYFEANYEDYSADARSAGLSMRLKDFLFLKDIGQIYPKAQMGDYSVTNEGVSGLEFRKSKTVLTEDGKTVVTMVIFSRTFKEKLFIAKIVYDNEEHGNAMIDLFKKSTFKE